MVWDRPDDLRGMGLFAWSSQYSVNVPEIDAQHKQLFRMANELHAAMLEGAGQQILDDLLNKLVAYTRWHFAAEEGLMRAHNYPDYATHRAQHEQLTATVLQFRDDFEAGRRALSIPLMKFLKDWLTHHIMGMDRKLGPYVRPQAGSPPQPRERNHQGENP